MNVEQLRELQSPIKSRYRDDPAAAVASTPGRQAFNSMVECIAASVAPYHHRQ